MLFPAVDPGAASAPGDAEYSADEDENMDADGMA
jgi:hypothetical protein